MGAVLFPLLVLTSFICIFMVNSHSIRDPFPIADLLSSYLDRLETSGISKDGEIINRSNSSLLPPLWDNVKKLNRINFKTDADGALIVDVWDYLQRMSLYKYLIENFHHCEFKPNFYSLRLMEEMMSISSPAEQDIIDTMKVFIESNINPWSIVWGLPLQHGWQYSSGRLETDANSTSINIKAWWADMNYYLSVIPYFGAYEAGFAPKIVLATHTDDERFCSSPSACRDVIKPWSDFFILLNETKNDCVDDNHQSIENYTPHTPLANSLDFNLSAGEETLLFSLWGAHLHSIGYALPLFENELALLNDAEATFGRSWAGIVDFIAMTNFLCDVVVTNVLQNLLPQHMLHEGDKPLFIDDITRLQNRAVFLIDGLYSLNTTMNGIPERLWNCSMCTEYGRAYGREMMTLGIYRLEVLGEDLIKLAGVVKDQDMESCPACLPSEDATF